MPDEMWRLDALCREVDADLFFPDKGGSPKHAQFICARCPVSSECLDYALRGRERFGIWGGTTETARGRILRRTA